MADDSTNTSADKATDHLRVLQTRGFNVGRLLGKGSYSRVFYLGPEPRAVKVIFKASCPKEYLEDFLPHELDIFPSVKHDNIIRFHDVIESPEVVCIIMDIADSGSLLERLQEDGQMDEVDARRLFKETALAVQYCHSEGIAHRDLKLDNLLLVKSGGITRVKLSDFGFSVRTRDSEGRTIICDKFCGSPPYTAPELLQKSGHYQALVADVWSLGVILYCMLFFRMPFNDSDISAMIHQQLNRNFRFPVSTPISKECKDLIAAILEPDVGKRLSVDNVLESMWLTPE